MEDIKVIFLDIDGVLNVGYPAHDDYGRVFHPEFVDNLKRIIDETGAKIVMSSTWRFAGLEKMKQMWIDRNLPGDLIDVTVDCVQIVEEGRAEFYDNVERGHEIQQWLDENPNAINYVILDDDNDFLTHQRGNFVRTANNINHPDSIDIGYGLTNECANKAIRILNYEYKKEPKYPIGGYAPGNYMCNCCTCKTQFQGDKRAVQCEPCAIEMVQEQNIIDMMKGDEELGLYDEIQPEQIWNEEKKKGVKEFIDKHKQECMITKNMQMDAEIAYNSLPKKETLSGFEEGHKANLDWLEQNSNQTKQKTLEEAAEIFVNNRFTKQICGDESYPDIFSSKSSIVESHILFAKWQQERSYSEEEVIKISIEYFNHYYNISSRGRLIIEDDLEWFEKFKKK